MDLWHVIQQLKATANYLYSKVHMYLFTRSSPCARAAVSTAPCITAATPSRWAPMCRWSKSRGAPTMNRIMIWLIMALTGCRWAEQVTKNATSCCTTPESSSISASPSLLTVCSCIHTRRLETICWRTIRGRAATSMTQAAVSTKLSNQVTDVSMITSLTYTQDSKLAPDIKFYI